MGWTAGVGSLTREGSMNQFMPPLPPQGEDRGEGGDECAAYTNESEVEEAIFIRGKKRPVYVQEILLLMKIVDQRGMVLQ